MLVVLLGWPQRRHQFDTHELLGQTHSQEEKSVALDQHPVWEIRIVPIT